MQKNNLQKILLFSIFFLVALIPLFKVQSGSLDQFVYLPAVYSALIQQPSPWQEVGESSAFGNGISINSGYSPSVAISSGGIVYVAWSGYGLDNVEIYVRQWDGNNWLEMGAGSASGNGISQTPGTSAGPSLAVAPDGTPYVAWVDDSSGNNEIYIRHWNGSNWAEVGTGTASGGGISNTTNNSLGASVVIATDNTPFIVWRETIGDNTEVYIRRWSGSAWEEVGAGSASGGGISNTPLGSGEPELAIAPNGTPYVAWREDVLGNYEIYIRRWNGSAWVEVGPSSASGGGVSNSVGESWSPSLAIPPDGTPYLVWSDDSGPGGDFDIVIRRWLEGANVWVEVGSEFSISDDIRSSWSPSLTVATDGTLYVAWESSTSEDDEIYVRRWNGDFWEQVGPESAILGGISNNTGESWYPDAAVSPDGVPYVVWEDDESGDWQIYIRRYLE